MERANCFLCFAQMYKQAITYSHYPLSIYLTDHFYSPCTEFSTFSTVQSRGADSDADAKLFLSQQLAASQKG